jgi:adenosylcobinamide-phosphate synthase
MTAGLFLAILLLDLLLGDPHGWPHPIIWIGRLINKTEDMLYDIKINKRITGVVLVICVVSATIFLALFALQLATGIAVWLGWLLALWAGWSCLALRSLHMESRVVIADLERGDLVAARQSLSMIVGRETAQLDEEGVLKATLETVAENASDGVIAPMFYMLLGGPVLGLVFKAVSTLDSMVGYKTEKYREFGWAGARLDDIFNYIPARLTGLLFVVAAYTLKLNGRAALHVMRRDAGKHTSPNAGWPEAAAAGALNLQLGGPAVYFGQLVDKPVFGDIGQRVTSMHYQQLIKLLYLATGFATLLGLLLLGGL